MCRLLALLAFCLVPFCRKPWKACGWRALWRRSFYLLNCSAAHSNDLSEWQLLQALGCQILRKDQDGEPHAWSADRRLPCNSCRWHSTQHNCSAFHENDALLSTCRIFIIRHMATGAELVIIMIQLGGMSIMTIGTLNTLMTFYLDAKSARKPHHNRPPHGRLVPAFPDHSCVTSGRKWSRNRSPAWWYGWTRTCVRHFAQTQFGQHWSN